MASYTQLPTRKLQKINLHNKDRFHLNSDDATIATLLHRLQLKFAADEANAVAFLPFYLDTLLKENEFPDQENLKVSTTPRPTLLQPSPPIRPSLESLAQLLDITYTEFSSALNEDTYADSNFGRWLASLAIDTSVIPSKKKDSSPFNSGNIEILPIDFVSLMKCPPDTQMTPSTPSKRPRAYSEPRTPSTRNNGVESTRSFTSPAERRVRFDIGNGIEDANNNAECMEELDDNASISSSQRSTAPSLPPFYFEIEPDHSNLQNVLVSPNSCSSFPFTPSQEQILASPGSNSIHISNDPDIDSPFLRFDNNEQKYTYSRNALEMTTEESSKSSIVLSPTHLLDLSGIHTFNLSLQHAAKSPHLLRNYQRVLDELNGRLGGNQKVRYESYHQIQRRGGLSRVASWKEKIPIQDPDMTTRQDVSPQANSSEGLKDPSLISTVSNESRPCRATEMDSPTYSFSKTHADQLLEQEYISHLRSSIATKQTEVEAIKSLMEQRNQTIARMEKILAKAALSSIT